MKLQVLTHRPVVRGWTVCSVLALAFALACGAPVAEPTPTPKPTPTPTLVPTPTPPISSIVPGCDDCLVVVPGEAVTSKGKLLANQAVINAYRAQPKAHHHPDEVILVSCYRGYRVSGLGYIMGAGKFVRSVKHDIGVSGRFRPEREGACYAIVARYDGMEEACIEGLGSNCAIGIGTTTEIMLFKGTGKSTKITMPQYYRLLEEAKKSEYPAAAN